MTNGNLAQKMRVLDHFIPQYPKQAKVFRETYSAIAYVNIAQLAHYRYNNYSNFTDSCKHNRITTPFNWKVLQDDYTIIQW